MADPGFRYHPPGALQKNDSRGRKDRIVYLPDIIFPIRLGPGQFPHMNSQIYGYGGCCGPGGSYSNPANWDPMNQWDNYCEARGHKMPLCTGAGAKGHQGQDIRPPSNKLAFYDAIAVVDGVIVSTSNYTSSVKLKGPDGTDYLYLHLEPSSIKVNANQKVKRGDVLGKVANLMNGGRGTSIHLHFQAQQTIEYGDKKITAWVPVYTSLIAALRKEKRLSSGIVNDPNGGKPVLVAEYPYEYGVPKPPEEAKQPPVEEAKQPPPEEAKQPPPEEAKQPPPEEAKQPPPEEAKQPPPEEAKQPPPEEAKQPPKEEPSLWRSLWKRLFNWWLGAPK